MNELKFVADSTRELRRRYSALLDEVIKRGDKGYNTEDLVRLVGTLEAVYNHCLASLAGDGDTHCILKHLSYALILAGELDEPTQEDIYQLLTVISNGVIEPCQSCHKETDETISTS